MRRALPYAFWLCLLILAILSWTPGADLPRTGFSGKIEHFVAYAGAMLLGGLAWPTRRHAPLLIGGLVVYAAAMELGQLVAPGRHASAWDFLAGAIGIVVTAAVLHLVVARSRHA